MAGKAFRGSFDHTIDDKGRLNFPSHFREVLRQHESEGLVMIPWGDNHLRVYPVEKWEIIEEKLMAEDWEQTEDQEDIIRELLSQCIDCTLDKQGRLLVPPHVRSELGLKKEIALIGMINRVEIWDKDVWKERGKVGQKNTEKIKQIFRDRHIH
jgi:transcriptional regulator MraZ